MAILSQQIFNFATPAATYTVSTFAVPAGTEMLVVIPTMRQPSGTSAAMSSVKHNGVTLTTGFSNYSDGAQDINSHLGYLRSPSIGTFDIVITVAGTSGGAVWVLALSGALSSGSPIGKTSAQKNSSSAATSVGLGFTPTAGSLLLTALASGNNTGTVSGFSGAGFVDDATGRYSANGDMPYTARHLLTATATAVSVSATFSVASPNCGGLLIEILAEVSGTNVSGVAAGTLDVTGSVGSGLSKAEITDASFRQRTAWTEIVSLQADAAGVARRIISAGVAGSPTVTLDQLAPGRNFSWRYRLADGNVQIDSGNSTQSLSPQHLALVHNGALGQELYLNGIGAGQVIEGAGLTGAAVVQGGETIGAHSAASPAPYTGLVGRYLLAGFAMTPEQVSLLALSEIDPDALWGVGVEDDAQVSNQSVVACPLSVTLDGQPNITLLPTILDPSGGTRTITSVTQPTNGTLAISVNLQLVYTPNRGWQGTDSATYTASDGSGKSSTGKLTFHQTRPTLKLTDDAVTVSSGGEATFNPLSNDVGAGTLTIVANSTPARGTIRYNPDRTLTYLHNSASGGTSDSFSYNAIDDYSEQGAIVNITITTGAFLIAKDVSVSTTKDKFIDVDVVAAADVSAGLAPAVVKSGSVTAPALGTAVLQTSGKIRYTPPTGNDGFSEEFDFTLKPSAAATPESTATVTVDVLSVSSALPKLQPEVAISRWHCVGFTQAGSKRDDYGSGRAGLVAAIGSATLVAGDVIVLADGTYGGGAITIARAGAAGNHIMLRARTHGMAIIDCQLTITGAYWWFTGIKFTFAAITDSSYHNPNGQAVLNKASGLWITNCRFTGHAFINIAPNNTNLRFCYNTINATTPGTDTLEDVGVFLTMICNQNDRPPGDTEIAWNRVTLPRANEVSAAGEAHGRHFLICHPSHSIGANPAFVQRGFKVHHNYAKGPWAEIVYCKRNICIEFNYFEWDGGTSQHDFTYRHGLLTNSPDYDIGGILRGNRFVSSKQVSLEMNGVGICITNNVNEGNSGRMRLFTGNGDTQPPRDGCDNIQLVENTGFTSIELGARGTGSVGADNVDGRNGKPDNCRLYRGNSTWTPTMSYGAGSTSAQVTFLSGYGSGNAAKVDAITSSELASAGCDPIA